MIHQNHDFKTIQIALFYINKRTFDTDLYRFLLPKLKTSFTKMYPSKRAINTRLEELYGATLSANTTVVNNFSITSYILTIVDPKLVGDTDLLHETLKFLKTIIVSNDYREVEANEELRILKEQLAVRFENKNVLAQFDFANSFFKDESELRAVFGDEASIKQFSRAKLEKVALDSRTDDFFYIVNGSISKSEEDLIKENLGSEKFDIILDFPKNHLMPLPVYRKKTISATQSIVKIGYQFDVRKNDRDYEGANIANLIIGGYVSSRLFLNIREKESLAYSIFSTYSPFLGTLTITGGVNNRKSDYACKKVLLEMEELIANGPTEEEVFYAKNHLIDRLREVYDNQQQMTSHLYGEYLTKSTNNLEKRIDTIEKITRQEVADVLGKLRLITRFILQGEEHEKV